MLERHGLGATARGFTPPFAPSTRRAEMGPRSSKFDWYWSDLATAGASSTTTPRGVRARPAPAFEVAVLVERSSA